MQSFENSPQAVAVKGMLREWFLAILETVGNAFAAFYEWLKNVPIPVPPPMLKMFSNNKHKNNIQSPQKGLICV